MVTSYNIISSKLKQFLSENAVFFNFLKVKHAVEMMQTAYSFAILDVKHKKLPFIAISNDFSLNKVTKLIKVTITQSPSYPSLSR